jgi:hypothetical protein
MNKNMGSTDRIVRILAAVAIVIFYFARYISGIAAPILGTLAVIFIATGVVGFCPLYSPFKISTKNKS